MKHLLFALLLALPSALLAQWEAGVQVGISNFKGDLSPRNIWTGLGNSHFSGGVFARRNIGRWVSVRAGFNYAKVSANDTDGKENEWRRYRNLNFRSNIFELGITGEFNILGYQAYNLRRTVSPYIFAGVAGFHFNPQARYEDDWVDLQPLGTEGQGIEGRPDAYNRIQFSIPLGIGLKYAINDKWNMGFEAGLRKTFTDYLDDVSGTYMDLATLAAANGELAAELHWGGDEINPDANPPAPDASRGNSKKKDWYIISGLTISYNFTDNGLVGSRGRTKRRKGCTTF